MIVDGPAVLNYAVNGIIAPVGSAFTQADMDDFLPGTTGGSFYRGEFYGPATNESSQAVIYNKALVEKYNIQVPQTLEDAWTWPEQKRSSPNFRRRSARAAAMIGSGLSSLGKADVLAPEPIQGKCSSVATAKPDRPPSWPSAKMGSWPAATSTRLKLWKHSSSSRILRH
ncbi:MAG: hypothetical protein IPK19_10565 [Chloroflexi bacterium]|nr:hypothetical protein [Chloroflexota bacterium]